MGAALTYASIHTGITGSPDSWHVSRGAAPYCQTRQRRRGGRPARQHHSTRADMDMGVERSMMSRLGSRMHPEDTNVPMVDG
jgi:hypothetical protein